MKTVKGLNAYLDEQAIYEKSHLNEPDQLIDEFSEKAKAEGLVLQEKETLKHIADSDLREKVPPQLYQVVSSLVKMIEKIEEA